MKYLSTLLSFTLIVIACIPFNSQSLELHFETLREIKPWELNSFRVFRSDFFYNKESFDAFCKKNGCDSSSFRSGYIYENDPSSTNPEDNQWESREVHSYVAHTTLSAMNITKNRNKALLIQISEYSSTSFLDMSKICESARDMGTCGLVKEKQLEDGSFYFMFTFYSFGDGRPKRNPLQGRIGKQ